MKKFMTGAMLKAILFTIMLVGCVAHITPEATYIEPLPTTVIVGPPVIVQPSPHIFVRPLPPVILIPERHIYFYDDIYYYYWGRAWYYSARERGPWHRLPRKYYPPRYRYK